ncbi:MAG: ROK family protein [Bacteroidetes bacterium]|jgi:glucokinase|nr:ROK family protein [Bacteroidota bacterium]
MKEVTIGIDIGGTFTKFGCIDINGKSYNNGVISTDQYDDIHAYIKDLHDEIRKCIQSANEELDIKGIGIGAPNSNYYTGQIEHAANLNWKGKVPIVDIVKQYFRDIPVLLTNDANAAALGEMVFGNARDMKNFIVITLGTGLGSGLVVNGQLVYGHDGFAGELGHVMVKEGGRLSGFGLRGSLETYVSATGIKRTAFALLADTNEESILQDFSYRELTSEDIYNAAMAGDNVAKQCFEYTAEILGKSLANTVAHTSPEAIFLFGGLAKAGDMIIKPAKKYMEEHLIPAFKNKVQIMPSGLLDQNVAVLGASALAWNDITQ